MRLCCALALLSQPSFTIALHVMDLADALVHRTDIQEDLNGSTYQPAHPQTCEWCT